MISGLRTSPRRWAVVLAAAVVMLSACADAGESYPPTLEVSDRAAAALAGARAARAESDFAAALARADSATAAAPNWPAAHAMRGDLLRALNRFDAADAAYQRALNHDPHHRGAWFARGQTAFLQGRYEAALEHYERERRLIETAPPTVARYYEESDRDALPNVLLQIGRTHALMSDFDAARTAYDAALDADSTRARGWAWLAELDEQAGETETALRRYRRAMTLAPFDPDYRFEVGRLLAREGRLDEAGALLSAVLRARPWHPGAAFNLGRVLVRTGDAERGQRLLARADSLQILQQEVDQALAAAYQQPNNAHRWIELGGLYIRSGRYEEAEDALGAALDLAPSDPDVRNDAANLALARGDTTLALRRYREVLTLDSTNADVWLNLGVVHAMQRRYDAARAAWRTALRHQPGHPDAAAYLDRLPSDS